MLAVQSVVPGHHADAPPLVAGVANNHRAHVEHSPLVSGELASEEEEEGTNHVLKYSGFGRTKIVFSIKPRV